MGQKQEGAERCTFATLKLRISNALAGHAELVVVVEAPRPGLALVVDGHGAPPAGRNAHHLEKRRASKCETGDDRHESQVAQGSRPTLPSPRVLTRCGIRMLCRKLTVVRLPLISSGVFLGWGGARR